MKLIGKTKINFLNKKNLALSISCLLICSGFISLIINSGPKLSIDFTGGRVTQVLFSESPVIPEIRLALEENGLGGAEVIEFGSANELLIKTGTDLNNDQTFSNFKNAFSDNVVRDDPIPGLNSFSGFILVGIFSGIFGIDGISGNGSEI